MLPFQFYGTLLAIMVTLIKFKCHGRQIIFSNSLFAAFIGCLCISTLAISLLSLGSFILFRYSLVCLPSWFVFYLSLSAILVCLPSWFVCHLGLSAILVCLLSWFVCYQFSWVMFFSVMLFSFHSSEPSMHEQLLSHLAIATIYLLEIFQNKWVTDNPTMLLFLL